jgi:5-methylcytosine-specific restriction endonuclease McrBC GTP-binding regulatory subunit McrB
MNCIEELIEYNKKNKYDQSISSEFTKYPILVAYYYNKDLGEWGYVMLIKRGQYFFPRQFYLDMIEEGLIKKVEMNEQFTTMNYKLFITMQTRRQLKKLGYKFSIVKCDDGVYKTAIHSH